MRPQSQLRKIHDFLQDACADGGVGLDNAVLLIVEAGGLVDNLIGNADFAHIMQKPHAVNIVLLAGGSPRKGGNVPGVFGYPQGMSLGVRVLGIHRLCQCQHCFIKEPRRGGGLLPGKLRLPVHLPAQIALQVLVLQHPPYPLLHGHGDEGLANKIHGTGAKDLRFQIQIRIPRQDNDGDIFHLRPAVLHVFQGLKPVPVRHIVVHKHEINAVFRQVIESLSAALGGSDLRKFPQNPADQQEVDFIVIHRKNQRLSFLIAIFIHGKRLPVAVLPVSFRPRRRRHRRAPWSLHGAPLSLG